MNENGRQANHNGIYFVTLLYIYQMQAAFGKAIFLEAMF